jgi:hypothetical protein
MPNGISNEYNQAREQQSLIWNKDRPVKPE